MPLALLPPATAAPLLSASARAGAGLVAVLLLALGGCLPASQRASGRVFVLSRHQPGDALAVVTRPGGEGLHIWLDPDTDTAGLCRPRWNPDAARLRGGDGSRPLSGGRAPRGEFYAAMARGGCAGSCGCCSSGCVHGWHRGAASSGVIRRAAPPSTGRRRC